MTNEQLEAAIIRTLGDNAEDYYVDEIADAIQSRYPDPASLDVVPSAEYWEIVRQHDRAEE